MASNFFSIQDKIYYTLWNKYRPSILKMMMAAEDGAQQYKLYSHEFKKLNARQRTFSFTFKINGGKALLANKLAPVAKDLVTVLQYSRKAKELMESHWYQFRLDRDFLLHVSRLPGSVESNE